MRTLTALALGALLGFVDASEAAASTSPTSIKATAPLSAGKHLLGRPFNAQFESIIGESGKTLFPDATIRQHKELGTLAVDWVVVDNTSQFRANANAWGISAGLKTAQERRYVSFRAIQLTEVVELDDTSAMAAAPPDATYYMSKIYLGRMYEIVVHGNKTEFNAGVKAQFPGRSDKDYAEIVWETEAHDSRISNVLIQAQGTSPDWIDTGVDIEAGDHVIVKVSGKVWVGGYYGNTGPDGVTSQGFGRLGMRIGNEVIYPGAQKIFISDYQGRAKFKVYDTDYSNNSKHYAIELVVISAAAMPPCQHVQGNLPSFKRKHNCATR